MAAAAIAAVLWLEIWIPPALLSGEVSTAVVCRGRDGAWGDVRWRPSASPPQRIEAPEGSRCRVLVRAAAASAFHASAEITWRLASQPVRIEPGLLRIIEAPPALTDIEWIGARDYEGVECAAESTRSRCLFVPVGSDGVIVSRGPQSLMFALISGSDVARVTWRGARLARLVRVRPPGAGPVTARAITIERAVKLGASQLFEARVASSVTIAGVGASAFWVDGDRKGGFLELKAPRAATYRIPLEEVLSASRLPLDISLSHGESIEGDVRARGRPAEGATVILSRLVETEQRENRGVSEDDGAPRERVEELRLDSAGTFRFEGLARHRYELLAIHPSLGRARVIVTPPSFPRLTLKPRSVIRGRVLENGVPLAGAAVQILPVLEDVVAAKNPLLLATERTISAIDGRFEITAPDEGRVILAIGAGESSQRIDLGDVSVLGESVDLGDIRLEAPREIEVVVQLPAGCSLRAAGPMGVAGLRIVSATRVDDARWRFVPPTGGRWLFAAVCGRDELVLEPAIVDIRPGHREPILLKVRR